MKRASYLILIIVSIFYSCRKDEATLMQEEKDLEQKVINHYAELVYQNYQDAYNSAVNLKTKIGAFNSTISSANFESVRNELNILVNVYTKSEPFRFYGGPIDALANKINPWPIYPSKIDFVYNGTVLGSGIGSIIADLSLDSNIINEIETIDKDSSHIIGLQAMEFLIYKWSYLNYSDTSRVEPKEVESKKRRRKYLMKLADLLVGHFQTLKDEWDLSKPNNYRSDFALDANRDSSLVKIIKGLSSMSKDELAERRIKKEIEINLWQYFPETKAVPKFIITQSAIENIFFGRYKRSDGSVFTGPSLAGIIQKKSQKDYEAIIPSIFATSTAVGAIPEDYMAPTSKSKTDDAIDTLKKQAEIFNDLKKYIFY